MVFDLSCSSSCHRKERVQELEKRASLVKQKRRKDNNINEEEKSKKTVKCCCLLLSLNQTSCLWMSFDMNPLFLSFNQTWRTRHLWDMCSPILGMTVLTKKWVTLDTRMKRDFLPAIKVLSILSFGESRCSPVLLFFMVENKKSMFHKEGVCFVPWILSLVAKKYCLHCCLFPNLSKRVRRITVSYKSRRTSEPCCNVVWNFSALMLSLIPSLNLTLLRKIFYTGSILLEFCVTHVFESPSRSASLAPFVCFRDSSTHEVESVVQSVMFRCSSGLVCPAFVAAVQTTSSLDDERKVSFAPSYSCTLSWIESWFLSLFPHFIASYKSEEKGRSLEILSWITLFFVSGHHVMRSHLFMKETLLVEIVCLLWSDSRRILSAIPFRSHYFGRSVTLVSIGSNKHCTSQKSLRNSR
jgi:hypothetical protein